MASNTLQFPISSLRFIAVYKTSLNEDGDLVMFAPAPVSPGAGYGLFDFRRDADGRSFSRRHGLSRISGGMMVVVRPLCCVVLFTTNTVVAAAHSRSFLLPPPPPSNAAPPVTTNPLSSVYAAIGAISGLVTIGKGIWALCKYCRKTSSSGDADDDHNRSTGGPSSARRDVELGYADPNGSAGHSAKS